ncbi:hypothetical protein V7O66_05230 [Methanolobus sp. ZRKC3]|uniref:hypothetical protein n=1 Tax=Methanolobus sp. ZRKC3 TaxID=3125786 RepID=UPI0032433AA0
MVRFFQKKEESTQLTDFEIEEIRKSAYNLGFEVGYHKHSEIGWVSEHYSMLEDLARESGLGALVSETYKKGKGEGSRAKERDLKSGLSKKEIEKHRDRANISNITFHDENTGSKDDSGYGGQIFAYGDKVGPIQKPSMTDMPKSTSRIKAIDRPTQIQGFKLLTPQN